MAYRQDLALEIIKTLRNGKTQEDLSAEINEVVNACRLTGKKGSFTLKVDVRPDKGDSGQYFLKPHLDSSKPKLDPGESIYWGTPEGNLQRTDPAQGELELKDVSRRPTESVFVDEPEKPVQRIS